MSDTEAKAKKKPKKKKILLMLLTLIVIGGGGVAGGLYASGGSLTGGGSGPAVDPNVPQLVPREGVSASTAAVAAERARNGRPNPRIFQATYHPLEGNFTSNLRGGEAFLQVGLGVSTYYDNRVIQNLERHDMAIRSAILLAISEADPAEITTLAGKEALKTNLRNAINSVLTNREGFGGIDDVYFTSFVTQ